MKTFFKKIITHVLEWEARLLLRRYKPKIIAVAGSVGKTSTKDAILAAIAPQVHAAASDKSFNSEIGIPLAILDLQNGWNNPFLWGKNIVQGLAHALIHSKDAYPEVLVLEVGSDRPGDIDRVIAWLPIDVVVMTLCPDIPVHVEFFKDAAELNAEDKKIVQGLQQGGALIINTDDPHQADLASLSGRVIEYGRKDAKVFPEEKIKQHLYPKLAALAVVKSLGLDEALAIEALRGHKPPKGRMNRIKGLCGSTIIDDTYNSSPVAVEEALHALGEMEADGNKVAILGDMLELGRFAKAEHLRLGNVATSVADLVIAVGPRAADFGASMHFPDVAKAADYMREHIGQGDIVLVKGSQGMRMERIVKSLMKHPERAKELLVRQEKEWESR